MLICGLEAILVRKMADTIMRTYCTMDVSLIYVTKCPTRYNYTQFTLSVNCSTCFGWFLHPSSGAQIAVSTASATGQPLLLPVGIVEGGETDLRVLVSGGFSIHHQEHK